MLLLDLITFYAIQKEEVEMKRKAIYIDDEAMDSIAPLPEEGDNPRLRRAGGFKLSPSSTRRKTWQKRRNS